MSVEEFVTPAWAFFPLTLPARTLHIRSHPNQVARPASQPAMQGGRAEGLGTGASHLGGAAAAVGGAVVLAGSSAAAHLLSVGYVRE